MLDDLLDEDLPLGNGHAPTDATQRAGAIIAALHADGRVTTPDEVVRLIYMLRRVTARPAIDGNPLRSQADDGGLGESSAP